jgi:CRISPR-associated protein Cas1
MDRTHATLIKQAVALPNLRLAWESVADNQGIPGADRISIRKWQRNWEERLVRMSREVLANTYKPGRLRQRRIPKRDRRQWRILRIPTITDRVLQRAVLQVLYPVYEPRFLDCSYGYRPGRSLQEAVERILVLRVNDYIHVLDADIDDFFNQVDHALLLELLAEDLPDGSLLQLVRCWLDIGKPDTKLSRGIPMGSPLSPLLANLYLHRLDQAVIQAGYEMVRYADDFLVFAESEASVHQAYQEVEACLARLKLRYEPSKTRLASFEKGFSFIGVWFKGDTYNYEWENKRIEVKGHQVDWLFSRFGPDYR